jgi:hypothetical protein
VSSDKLVIDFLIESSRTLLASTYKSGSMRLFLETEVNRERGREGEGRSSESQTGSLGQSSKLAKFGRFERARILK